MLAVAKAMGATLAESITVGSVVTATGWQAYDANKLSHLGYSNPKVLTNVEFEEFVKNNSKKKSNKSKRSRKR